jgi:ubiquinone/menaquinone biosynthesis C-methylase UbiE
MDHDDHVNLVRGATEGAGLKWADLGAGTGAFTLALADLLGPRGEILAIDRNGSSLDVNRRAIAGQFPAVSVRYEVADFTRPLKLSGLDGILMANSLHFQTAQEELVRALRNCLRPEGRLAVVEYNIEGGNAAVPYPVPFTRWQALAQGAGFANTKLLARRPSRFLREIYSAVSW